jgi:pilus assembly protein Flp/PilA
MPCNLNCEKGSCGCHQSETFLGHVTVAQAFSCNHFCFSWLEGGLGPRSWLFRCSIYRQRGHSLHRPYFKSTERKDYPMKNLMIRLWKEEEGQDLTEYALLLVLLSLAAIASLGTLANAINNAFSRAATNLTSTT